MEDFVYNFILIVLPILIFGFFLLIAILITNRVKYDSSLPKIKIAKVKIDVFLTRIVFSSFDEAHFTTEINQFKKEIPFKENWCKKILLDDIVFFKLNLKGDVTNTFHHLYEQFNLFKYTRKLLHSKKYYLVCLGMYHLEALDYKKGKKYIVPFFNHKNRILDSSAYLTSFSLEPEKLASFIDYSMPISIAGEINIMNILHQKKPPMPLNIRDWINAKNPSIVKLGIKLMVFYNYTNENQNIMKLLKHEENAIRFEVIVAAKELFILEAEPFLIEQFDHEDKKNQSEIFNTLASIGTEESEQFISNLLTKSIDNDIKLEAVFCLNKINPAYFETVFTDNPEIRKMANHVKIPYI